MKTVKLFRNGGSQAMRIPKEFSFKSSKVVLTKTDQGLLVQPSSEGIKEWYQGVCFTEDFLHLGRQQPSPKSGK